METFIGIAKFLGEMGYIKKVFVSKVSENELELDILCVSVLNSSVKLVESGRSPSH